jgi:hypothetical protein
VDLSVLAYLDPGSGSMLVQLLVGGLAGAGVVFRFYGRSLLNLLTGQRRTVVETPADV